MIGQRGPRRLSVTLFLTLQAALASQAMCGQDQAALAADELWRRGHCILSNVVVPAEKVSQAPQGLRGATAVEGRTFSLKVRIAAWARDARFLWLATDTEVIQIDLAARRVLRSYGKGDGLPDWPVDDLASDGRTLWIVHRQGLATLAIGQAKVRDRADVRFGFARLLCGPTGVWVVADNGTYSFRDGAAAAAKAPPLPTGRRIAAMLDRGVWLTRRQQKTAFLVADPVCLADRLYVASYGAIYELANDAWREVAPSGWSPRAGHGCLWFLDPKGLVQYDPGTGKLTAHAAPECVPEGRPSHLAVTEAAVWVAVEPRQAGEGFTGGGLARLDVASGRWQHWQAINGHKADWVTALDVRDGALWAATIDYETHQTLSAHPGMMHCKQTVPVATGLCLHRFDSGAKAWQTVRLANPTAETRLILGQRGKRQEAVMSPRIIETVEVGPSRIFGVVRLFPKDFYSGYYTSIDQLAVRGDPGAAWAAAYAHHPEQLGLQGEQPLVLLISESHGKRVVHGDGHDRVHALFTHEGRVWAVTEGCAAWFDTQADRWRQVVEPGFRFYWKGRAALDDGQALWVGSDRGVVARLDLATGRFEPLAVLQDREIASIARTGPGQVVVGSRRAARGCLPVQLEGKLPVLDCDAAASDGTAWKPSDAAPATPKPTWDCDEKTNFLRYIGPPTGEAAPRLFLKGVFQPRFLCASPDGRRVWLATYSGLLRVDR